MGITGGEYNSTSKYAFNYNDAWGDLLITFKTFYREGLVMLKECYKYTIKYRFDDSYNQIICFHKILFKIKISLITLINIFIINSKFSIFSYSNIYGKIEGSDR